MIPPMSSSLSHVVNFSHIKSNEFYPPSRGPPPLEGGTPHIQFLPRLTEQPGEQGDEDDADEGDTAARHKLFHTQIGVGNRLDGGRRCVKKYLWSFLRTAPAGQVRL